MKNFLFRKATDKDIWDVHAWRNAEKVRNAMLTQHEISGEEHQKWWARKMQDPSFSMMLLEQDGLVKAVQIFFDIQQEKTGWWAFYFTPHAPEEMGPMLQFWKMTELAGLSYAFDTLKLDQLTCEVLLSNQGVLNWHKRFGAKVIDQSTSQNTQQYDLEVMEFTRSGYVEKRDTRWAQPLSEITFQTDLH